MGEGQAARGGVAGHRERRLGGRRLPAASDGARGAPAFRHLLGHGGLHPEAVNCVVPAVKFGAAFVVAGGAASVLGQALLFSCAQKANFEAVDCEGLGFFLAGGIWGFRAAKLHAGPQGRQGLRIRHGRLEGEVRRRLGRQNGQ